MERDELGAALREHAYLEGDFVLRSGRRSRYYLDKYRFETRPELLGPLGEAIAQAVQEFEPEASRPRYFITEPGMGYRFEQGSDRAGSQDCYFLCRSRP